jgi:hypothetical protein
MTTSLDTPSDQRSRPGVFPRFIRTAGRSLLYCAALIPVATLALLAALCGRTTTAASWWRGLRTRVLGQPAPHQTGRPGVGMMLGHSLVSLLLGAVALVPLGVELAFVLRGVFYGLVDHGPYNHSWGGPSRGGAWVAHFLVSLPLSLAGALALIGIAAVHQRLTSALDGGRPARWLVPVALFIPLPAVALFIAWLHQI